MDPPQAIFFKVMHAAYSDLAASGFKTSREDGRWCQDARFGGFLKWKWTKTMGFKTKKNRIWDDLGVPLFFFFGNLYFWCLKCRFVFLAMLHARSFSSIGFPGAFPSPLGGSLISHEDERRWSAWTTLITHEQTWNPTTWVISHVPMFHITQPWSVYGLLDGYFFRWCPIFPFYGTFTNPWWN